MCILPKKRPLFNTMFHQVCRICFLQCVPGWVVRAFLASHGPVLLISLCNGVGCATLALLALGIPFCLVAVELDPEVSQVWKVCFGHTLFFQTVSTFQLEHLPASWLRFRYWLVLVVGNAGRADHNAAHVRRIAASCLKVWPTSCTWAVCQGPASLCFSNYMLGPFHAGHLSRIGRAPVAPVVFAH